MVDEPKNLTLKQLALLREDVQAGFASIHAELSSLAESVRAMARSQVTMQRDITQLKDRVIVLTAAITAAIDEHPPTHP